eukprot:CAMPEP_0184496142 /NCGR_PEP_ID=MMETSP0113_2-20130426/33222_1 /TAXON_ID=91329 /ORGANISM="Norrisiella sphaerica, Strain BC52" /LENGTH=300 /DNA_ID=CAMNT_0026882653 /DNA_START=302 /DNA_END=1204 /DNA_ORIENTATION=-
MKLRTRVGNSVARFRTLENQKRALEEQNIKLEAKIKELQRELRNTKEELAATKERVSKILSETPDHEDAIQASEAWQKASMIGGNNGKGCSFRQKPKPPRRTVSIDSALFSIGMSRAANTQSSNAYNGKEQENTNQERRTELKRQRKAEVRRIKLDCEIEDIRDLQSARRHPTKDRPVIFISDMTRRNSRDSISSEEFRSSEPHFEGAHTKDENNCLSPGTLHRVIHRDLSNLINHSLGNVGEGDERRDANDFCVPPPLSPTRAAMPQSYNVDSQLKRAENLFTSTGGLRNDKREEKADV